MSSCPFSTKFMFSSAWFPIKCTYCTLPFTSLTLWCHQIGATRGRLLLSAWERSSCPSTAVPYQWGKPEQCMCESVILKAQFVTHETPCSLSSSSSMAPFVCFFGFVWEFSGWRWSWIHRLDSCGQRFCFVLWNTFSITHDWCKGCYSQFLLM